MTETAAPAQTADAAPPENPDAPETGPEPTLDDPAADGGESADGEPGEPQGDHGGNREARYRVRAREAEAERDALREQLASARREGIDEALAAAGLRPALFDAAGLEVDDFLGEDGRVDRAAAVEAARSAAADLGVDGTPRRPAPNPIAGTPSAHAPAGGRAAWDTAFGVKG
ncbi:hypothetical protein A5634_22285 [Mycobacterium asiaticum]|uniref:Scaffolding protein n=2 Tax=Mycobacterium asiaticum TaxID=1790 RepID=A0A1A3P0B7_MYCAS|nr:hypothetical protein A5634_22285 [Mycobacterium asiaticum]